MKKFLNWRIFLGISLVALSVILYFVHFSLFHDGHHIFIYFWGDVAFVPIEVLMVTLIIHHVLEGREKRSMLKKLNMLIGAFYSEVGNQLLKYCSEFDPDVKFLRGKLKGEENWSKKQFDEVKIFLKKYKYHIVCKKDELQGLHDFVVEKKIFLLNLLANPNLLEHESFTELLWAVFHLAEEFANRKDLKALPEADLNHIAGDIKRAYAALSTQWIDYMEHLKADYPYLFSLALRTNPFDPKATPIFSDN